MGSLFFSLLAAYDKGPSYRVEDSNSTPYVGSCSAVSREQMPDSYT